MFAAEYFGERLHLSETQRNLVSDGFVVLVTLIKLGGTDYIVKASGTLFVMSVIPITIFVLVGAKDLEPSTWIDTDTSEEAGGMSMNLLISYVIWTFSGFTALGSLAGETKNPGRSYPIVIAILLPFVRAPRPCPLLDQSHLKTLPNGLQFCSQTRLVEVRCPNHPAGPFSGVGVLLLPALGRVVVGL